MTDQERMRWSARELEVASDLLRTLAEEAEEFCNKAAYPMVNRMLIICLQITTKTATRLGLTAAEMDFREVGETDDSIETNG